jgi:hypothetical protein
MRLSLTRLGALRGSSAAVAVAVAAATLLSASSPPCLVLAAAEGGIRGEGAVSAAAAAVGAVAPERILADADACATEMDAYQGCVDANGLQACDSTCVAPEFEDTKNQLMIFNIRQGGYVSCEAAKLYYCWAMEACECVQPCYTEAYDLLLCQNGDRDCPDKMDMDCGSGSGSSSGGGGSSNGADDGNDDEGATTDDTSTYDDDDETDGDDSGGDDSSNGTGDDSTTTGDDDDNYYYDDDGSSGAGSTGCSSALSSYKQCLAENNIEWCDTCAGSAYDEIANQLKSNFLLTGSFGTCSSISSYACSVFEQCECLSPCLAETAAFMECDTQDSLGCEVDCASASSFSFSRAGEGSEVVGSFNDTAGGGLANHTKQIQPAEAANGTGDAAANQTKEKIPAEAASDTSDATQGSDTVHRSLLFLLGMIVSIGFELLA